MDEGTRILDRDGHTMHVMDYADGRLILLITMIEEGINDGFTVGLAPPSLAQVRAGADDPALDWTISDETLRIVASADRGGAWDLTFSMNAPPFLSATIPLTTEETALFREALLG
jgi:hypothetical protein